MGLQELSLENGNKIREKLSILPSKEDFQELSEEESKYKLNKDGTLTMKNKLVMREGLHNEVNYSWDELKSGFMTGEGGGLFYDHEDSVKNYSGLVKNLRADEETKEIFGDVYVTDKQAALNISLGAKWGLSPTIDAEKVLVNGETHAIDILFLSYSLVLKPAVRETMLNQANDSNRAKRRLNMEDNKRELQLLAEKDAKIQRLEEEKSTAEGKAEEAEKKAEESEKKAEESEKKVEESEKKEEEEESEKLCALECSIGFTSEADKNSRLEELKSLSAESRSLLKNTHEKYMKTLKLGNEIADDGKDYAEKLKENFMNFRTEFLKQNPKASPAQIQEAFEKLAANPGVNKKPNEILGNTPQEKIMIGLAEEKVKEEKINSNILAYMKEQEQK